MLTKIRLKNFKRFGEVEVELGSPVVFIGPNNSGKTTALQALALWQLSLKRWLEKRGSGPIPRDRPGVTINRRDLPALPSHSTKLLWKDLHVRLQVREEGKRATQNILIELEVEGVSNGRRWRCGFELDYANEESFYCRPLRLGPDPKEHGRMEVPEEVEGIDVAFLPPMSGLAETETRKPIGAIQVALGEGRTAEVLRNLCHQVLEADGGEGRWRRLTKRVEHMFGVTLLPPEYVPERGELRMSYRERTGTELDLSSAGRGLQQTLLLLAYLANNPGATLLIDEPDAHLEILRQRETYHLLTQAAAESSSQVVIASHSEVILNEAADRDVVVAFVGEPHRIDDRGSQVAKSLKEIGFEQYYQAEQRGWVLYLEGATDLAIMQSFAERLNHPALAVLERPFVHYILNQPSKARDHFFGLREAKPDLVGLVICDRLDQELRQSGALVELMWARREIENYLCQPRTLLRFAEQEGSHAAAGPLFDSSEREKRRNVMERSIRDLVPPVAFDDHDDSWWKDVKASDEFLDRLFERYYTRLDLPNLMRKTDYHRLAPFVSAGDLSDDVRHVLDRIVSIADKSRPLWEEPE